jgi:hypothetical protein
MSERHGSAHDLTDRHGSAHDVSAGLRPPPRPRWVIWLLIAIAVLALVLAGAHFLSGGHGSMKHMPGMNHGMPASVIQHGLGGDAA